MTRLLTIALIAAIAFVVYACGGGGSEQPEPRPGVDCNKTPEQCK